MLAATTMHLRNGGRVALRPMAAASLSGGPYTERQARLGRPVSPHVTIYDFPIAALTSITHRVAGVELAVGMYGVGIGALVGLDVPEIMYSIGSMQGIGALFKFCIAFPFTFHFLGGIRHIYWEMRPEGLNAESQKQASLALVGTSAAISLATLFF